MRYKTLLKLLLTALLFAFVLQRISIPETLSLLRQGRPGLLLAAGLAAVAFIGLRWLKWHLLLQGKVSGLTPWRSFYTYLVGTAAGLVTPGRVGELGRAVTFRGEDRARAAGLVVFDRLIDLATVLGYALTGLFIFSRLLGLAAVACLIVLLALLLKGHGLAVLFRRLPFGGRLADRLETALQAWGGFSASHLTLVLVVSVLSFGVSLGQFYLLSRAISAHVTWPAVLGAFPLLVLASAVPFTISGFGARESVAVLALGRYAVPPEVAVSATLLSFLFNVGLPGLIGSLLPFLFKWTDEERPDTEPA